MKVSIKPITAPSNKFPVLWVSELNGKKLILMEVFGNKQVVLFNDLNNYEPGYVGNWSPAKSTTWKPFTGEITLSND